MFVQSRSSTTVLVTAAKDAAEPYSLKWHRSRMMRLSPNARNVGASAAEAASMLDELRLQIAAQPTARLSIRWRLTQPAAADKTKPVRRKFPKPRPS
jgi:hypothetical protein